MLKILNEFNNNCGIKSNLANFIWKVGIIIDSISYCICTIYFKKNSYIPLYFIIMIVLFIISHTIFIMKAARAIGENFYFRQLFNIKRIGVIYRKIDQYQKDWITKYCKKNKLNVINKLEIMIQEIRLRKEKNTIKYINPIIIGTLCITVWEIALQKATEKIGFWNMIPITIVLTIGISLGIGWITKEIIEDKKFFDQFERYIGYKRLEELLVYSALKCKK